MSNNDDFGRAFAGCAITPESERWEAAQKDKVRRMLAALEGSANRLGNFYQTQQDTKIYVAPPIEARVAALLACCSAQQLVLEMFLSEFADMRTMGMTGPLLFPGLREHFKAKELEQSKPNVEST